MHVQDYGNIAVFKQPVPFQDLLDTLHVERSVPFQALLDSFHVERRVSFQVQLFPLGLNLMGYSTLKSYMGTDDIAAYLRIIACNHRILVVIRRYAAMSSVPMYDFKLE